MFTQSCENKKPIGKEPEYFGPQMEKDGIQELWKHNILFEFQYNNDTYLVKFFGKDITCVAIEKNNEKTGDSIVLGHNDVNTLLHELKKSLILYTDSSEVINVSYHAEGNYETRIEAKIKPTEWVINYLTQKVLYIYYLPVYTVKYGDTLSEICYKIYGDTNYDRIVKVNPQFELEYGRGQKYIVTPGERLSLPPGD